MNFYLVRYGAMRGLAAFKYTEGILIPSQKVIVRTERGLELGTVVNRTEVDEKKVNVAKMGTILRKVTSEDQKRLDDIENRKAPEELRYARERVAELKLPMKIIYVEHLFAGDRVVFYFLANGRVDFRKLVKELARSYQTRIELKQIGVRDEARLLSDYEHCGRELCCRAWIKKLQPVTMKLAKNQKATLDPTKISGGCGRLMCCLRYEDKTYEELRKNLPPKKSFVRTSQGSGEVVDYDVLTQTVVLSDASGKRFMVGVEDIKRFARQLREESAQSGKDHSSETGTPAEAGCPHASAEGTPCDECRRPNAKEEIPAVPNKPTAEATNQNPSERRKDEAEAKKPAGQERSGSKSSKGRRHRSRSARGKRRTDNRAAPRGGGGGENKSSDQKSPATGEKKGNEHPKKERGGNNRRD